MISGRPPHQRVRQTRKAIWQDAGKVSAEIAKAHAESELGKLGLVNDIKKIENSEKKAMAKIWDKEQLRILLGK